MLPRPNETDTVLKRYAIRVSGRVQGVGFRPFAVAMANRLDLRGFVRNDERGVYLEAEGFEGNLQSMIDLLRIAPTPQSRVDGLNVEEILPRFEKEFKVSPSTYAGPCAVLAAPDWVPCSECLRELRDPANRRHAYPFITCAQCGPRFTIITGLPYDRERTSMTAFGLCPACRTEYENPRDRRFHAETISCWDCGPRLSLYASNGVPLQDGDPLAAVKQCLCEGGIAAIKGVGGFHLACDAANAAAVTRLRERKQRDHKPFALMARDSEAVRKIACLNAGELRAIESPERPILLLRKRAAHGLAESIAPGQSCFGVMLPSSPVHALLLDGPCSVLVMTSGNDAGAPVILDNREALSTLGPLADLVLTHDRGIVARADDSVVRIMAGRPRFLRRARGYVPETIALPCDTRTCEVLAVGAELSNTVCLTRQGEACMSAHIGDLGQLGAYEALADTVSALERLLGVHPSAVACDLHPGYSALRYACTRKLPLVQVQHHHAHIASVLAETGQTGPVIGVAFDGLGWGDDGTLWGGEFLVCDLDTYERAGYLTPVPQPGGDAAARHADRMAYAYLRGALDEARLARLLPGLPNPQRAVLDRMIATGANAPRTSSMGRLFDAASAILGICTENAYHAQAPMELEARAAEASEIPLPPPVDMERDAQGRWLLPGSSILLDLLAKRESGVSVEQCAAYFHGTIATAAAALCRRIRNERNLEVVALSGGVFSNAILLETLVSLLDKDGFRVLLNTGVPANDGGLSLGQAAVAAWRRACV